MLLFGLQSMLLGCFSSHMSGGVEIGWTYGMREKRRGREEKRTLQETIIFRTSGFTRKPKPIEIRSEVLMHFEGGSWGPVAITSIKLSNPFS